MDRVERCLRALGGRARFQDLLERIRAEEDNPDLSYQTVYIAIQLENQRLDQLGERTRFVTSREDEERGWVRLREESEFPKDSPARNLEAGIREANERVSDDIRRWLAQMDWRTFETTFLIKVLEALGFQDVQPTQADSGRRRGCAGDLQTRNHRGKGHRIGEEVEGCHGPSR